MDQFMFAEMLIENIVNNYGCDDGHDCNQNEL